MSRYDTIRTKVIPDVHFHQNRYAKRLYGSLQAGDRVLDIGAGKRPHGGWRGPGNDEISEQSGLFIGCDLLKNDLQENRFLDLRVIANAEQLPLSSATLDVVSANMVLEHLAAPERVFREVYRVLRAGGRFVFVTTNRLHPFVLLAKQVVPARGRRSLARLIEGRTESDIFPTWYRANTRRVLRRLCTRVGFEEESLSVFFSYPMLRRPALATMVESTLIRLAPPGVERRIGSNILGCLRKP